MSAEYITLGEFAADRGKFQLAEKCYRKAVALEPDNKNVDYEMGVFFFRTKRYKEAVTEFNKYLKGAIISPEGYFYLAYSYFHLGNLDKAEEYFKRVLQINPEDPDTYVGLGVIAQSRHDPAQAKAYYEKALEIDPNCQEAVERLKQFRRFRSK